MKYSAETQIEYELVRKCYWRKPEVLLLAASILKFVVIFFFYQHVINYESSPPQIVSGYGWDKLLSSMYQGKYEMISQSGLSDIYDLKSSTGRPPIYPIVLYVITYLTGYSAAALVFVKSVITSFVAYLGYRIVTLSTSREKPAIICLWTLFLFPMNFLKSGTIDEAPLMLAFMLAALYLLGQYVRNPDRFVLLISSGVLMGLSTMTRYQTLPVAVGLVLYLLISRSFARSWKQATIFIITYSCILLPWVVRNYFIYGKPVLFSGGAGRILLMTQSEEFVQSFPYESPDSIERRYLRSFHKSHEYLSELDSSSLDEEFKRYAISEAINSPLKYCRAFVTKLKTFVPYRYYSVMDSVLRDIIFVSWYSASLLFFLWSIVRHRPFKPENVILLIAIIGWILPGLVYFMLSRHLYPVIVLMIVFSFVAYSDYRKRKKSNGVCQT